MRYKTLIFDLDGTISDPSQGIARSANFALDSLGYQPVEESRVRPLIGPPLQYLLKELAGNDCDENMHELIAKYRERYASAGYAENELYSGIPDSIAELSAQGARLGVCTSKRTDFAESILKMFGLRKYFAFVDGGDIGIEKEEQLAALVEKGLEPRTTVMIGDRAVDIQAAKNNKIDSVGVLWGFGESSEIAEAQPDHAVDSPAELVRLLADS